MLSPIPLDISEKAFVATLLTVTTALTFIFAVIFPVRSRKMALLSALFNLLELAGTWGFMSFIVMNRVAYVVSEEYCFALLGYEWRSAFRLGMRWGFMSAGCVLILWFLSADPFSIAAGVGFAIFSRIATLAPSQVLLQGFDGPAG